jgi:hypothetical protein
MHYTTENTEGYSSEELAELNRIYNYLTVDLIEDVRNNSDLLQQISEDILTNFNLFS